MKAVVYDRYGPPTCFRVEQVRMPTPGPKQVLVEVVATSVNLSDWECLRGTRSTRGSGACAGRRVGPSAPDIAGRVHAVGPGVTQFGVGDEVYSDNLGLMGGFAEYAVAPESVLALKPAALTFAEASTLPQAAAIALRGTAGVGEGQRMLINRSGGSGSFAIQLAKRAEAHVTGVDNAGGFEFMRSLENEQGGRPRRTDFTQLGPFDHILDLVAYRSGVHLSAGAGPWRPVPLRGWAGADPPADRHDRRLAQPGSPGAASGCWWSSRAPRTSGLAERCVAGDVQIHIGLVRPGTASRRRLYVGEGRALGKVVIET